MATQQMAKKMHTVQESVKEAILSTDKPEELSELQEFLALQAKLVGVPNKYIRLPEKEREMWDMAVQIGSKEKATATDGKG